MANDEGKGKLRVPSSLSNKKGLDLSQRKHVERMMLSKKKATKSSHKNEFDFQRLNKSGKSKKCSESNKPECEVKNTEQNLQHELEAAVTTENQDNLNDSSHQDTSQQSKPVHKIVNGNFKKNENIDNKKRTQTKEKISDTKKPRTKEIQNVISSKDKSSQQYQGNCQKLSPLKKPVNNKSLNLKSSQSELNYNSYQFQEISEQIFENNYKDSNDENNEKYLNDENNDKNPKDENYDKNYNDIDFNNISNKKYEGIESQSILYDNKQEILNNKLDKNKKLVKTFTLENSSNSCTPDIKEEKKSEFNYTEKHVSPRKSNNSFPSKCSLSLQKNASFHSNKSLKGTGFIDALDQNKSNENLMAQSFYLKKNSNEKQIKHIKIQTRSKIPVNISRIKNQEDINAQGDTSIFPRNQSSPKDMFYDYNLNNNQTMPSIESGCKPISTVSEEIQMQKLNTISNDKELSASTFEENSKYSEFYNIVNGNSKIDFKDESEIISSPEFKHINYNNTFHHMKSHKAPLRKMGSSTISSSKRHSQPFSNVRTRILIHFAQTFFHNYNKLTKQRKLYRTEIMNKPVLSL